MNINFKKDISASYMVIEKVEEFSKNDFAVKMLSNNDIPGLLKVDHENLNGSYDLRYDISSMQAFSILFEKRPVTYEQLRAFIFSLKALVDVTGEYLLDINNVILKQQCFFADSAGKEYRYCYFPYYKGDFKLELRIILKALLAMVDHADERVLLLAYDLHNAASSENYVIEDLALICNQREGHTKIELKSLELEDVDTEDSREQKIKPYTFEEEEDKSKTAGDERYPEENDSFWEKTVAYMKGRKIMDILEDINSGGIVSRIKG